MAAARWRRFLGLQPAGSGVTVEASAVIANDHDPLGAAIIR